MAMKLVEVSCPICFRNSNQEIATGYDFEYATSKQEFYLRECKGCGLIYLSPRPDISELSTIYPSQYNPLHFHKIKNPVVRWGRQIIQRKKIAAIKKILPKAANILDVGCGSGALLLLLRQYGSKDWQLFGNDFNSESLSNLHEMGITTFAGRFEQIDIKIKFDLIILNQALEHMDHPSQVIKKSFEILSPGGLIFIETPSSEGIDAKLFKKRYWGGYHIPRHWTIFSKKSLSAAAKKQGFQDIQTSYLASPSFWIQSFHHYFLDKGYPGWWVKMWIFKNPVLLFFFTIIDILTILFGKTTSNMRLIAYKPSL